MSLFKNAGWANQLTCDVNRSGAGICYLNVFVHLTLKGLGFQVNACFMMQFDDFRNGLSGGACLTIMLLDVQHPLSAAISRIFLLSKTFADKCVEEEPWYHTKYLAINIAENTFSVIKIHLVFFTPRRNSFRQFNPHFQQILTSCKAWRNSPSNPELRFPEPNSFITTEFDLLQNKCPMNVEMPELLIETEMSRIWYFQDTEFNLPKGFIKFHIVSLSTFCSPLHEILCAFYVNLFLDQIYELNYSSVFADITVHVGYTNRGITLLFSGFTHKLINFVQEIVTQLVDYCEPKTDRFECIREKISQNITNFSVKPTHHQACTYLTNITLHHSWINDDFIQALKDKFVDYFSKSCFSTSHIDVSNFHLQDAIHYYEMIRDLLIQKFDSKPLLLSHIATPREVIIPEGYIVQAGLRRSNKLQGFRILVQSSYHPNKIDKCIEEFLLTVNKLLEDMSDEEFNVHVQSLMTHLLEKPKGMQERFGRLWSEIACRHYNFKRNVHAVSVLKSLKKNNIINFFKEYIDPSSCTRRKLVVQIISSEEHLCDSEFSNHGKKVVVLKNHTELKRYCPLSSLTKPFMMFTSKYEGISLRF
ncbi:unnamed protein product [Schistosoma mattheei]|uniref:Uncharacterized protein n=1 Tax=Schistosoma mattheei TaxID=31246 RepID=A0A3P8DM10_9TREM|nr:unnamed protein product [Schistosoma mattheei]